MPPGHGATADMGAPPKDGCPTCGQPVPLLSVSDAAYVVGVTRKTIYRWIDKGILAPIRLPSGLLRIRPESLMRILHPRPGGGEPVSEAAAAPASGQKRTPAVAKPRPRRRQGRAYADGE